MINCAFMFRVEVMVITTLLAGVHFNVLWALQHVPPGRITFRHNEREFTKKEGESPPYDFEISNNIELLDHPPIKDNFHPVNSSPLLPSSLPISVHPIQRRHPHTIRCTSASLSSSGTDDEVIFQRSAWNVLRTTRIVQHSTHWT